MRPQDLNQARFLWLICFTTTLGAIPAGRVGNTYIPLSWVFTCLYLVCTLFSGRGYLRIVKSWSHRFLIAYVFYCGMTLILPYTAGIGDQVIRVFKGLLVLIGNVGIFMAITINPSRLKVRYMIQGLLAGAVLNALYGIYQYIGSFYQLPWVNLPTPMPIADPMLLHRAQGFTSEPSVLVSLLIPGILLGLGWGERRWVLLTVVMSVALILTFSSGIVFLGVACIVYSAAKVFNALTAGRIQCRVVRRIALAAVVLLSVGALVALLGGSPVSERLRSIFTGANPLDIENKARLESILYSLKLWIEYPLGVGYNMGPTIMERFGYSSNIHSIFSGILLETGLVGLFLYSMFVISSTYPLLRKGTTILDNMLGVAGVTSLLYSFATGTFSPFQMALWGISTVVGAGYRIRSVGTGLRRETNACPSL